VKAKFYWVALLASAALIGQAQGDGNHRGGGMGGGFGGGGGRAGPVGGGGGFHGGGFHAYRATLQVERVRCIGGLSIIMDESADP